MVGSYFFFFSLPFYFLAFFLGFSVSTINRIFSSSCLIVTLAFWDTSCTSIGFSSFSVVEAIFPIWLAYKNYEEYIYKDISVSTGLVPARLKHIRQTFRTPLWIDKMNDGK